MFSLNYNQGDCAVKITVECPEAIIARIKQLSRGAFPKEVYAYLLGTRVNSTVYVIEDLFLPTDPNRYAKTHKTGSFPDSAFVEGMEAAEEFGGKLIGDFHSHPYTRKEILAGRSQQPPIFPDCALSEDDYHPPTWERISAICLVTETKDGRLRCRVRFWPVIPLELARSK